MRAVPKSRAVRRLALLLVIAVLALPPVHAAGGVWARTYYITAPTYVSGGGTLIVSGGTFCVEPNDSWCNLGAPGSRTITLTVRDAHNSVQSFEYDGCTSLSGAGITLTFCDTYGYANGTATVTVSPGDNDVFVRVDAPSSFGTIDMSSS